MSQFPVIVTTAVLLASVSMEAQTMITRGDARPVRPGPAENFTGDARIEMLFDPLDPSQAGGGSVTFAAGARTAWHAHPGGQILIVTAGTGRVQQWGGPLEEIRAGDVVTIPPAQKHWHGASPHATMTHIAITRPRDGKTVEWMEKVTDEQFNAVIAEQPRQPSNQPQPARPSGPVQQRIAPGLATLTDDVLYGDVWRRAELSPRDRSLVTLSVLIATGKPAQIAAHLGRALDNGVRPSEASALLAHLAIYCGWPSAVTALEVFDQVFTTRKVDTAGLRSVAPRLAAPASDAARAQGLSDEFARVAPKFVQLTNDVVFDDLWRRSDLTVRDRSLVTIAALAGMGDDDQLDFYLLRAQESGLTRAQITEAMTHLGFYAGWSKATRGMAAVTRTLGK